MKFDQPLIRGRLVRRYKRFLCDVEIAGAEGARTEIVTAHCPNPGSMLGLTAEGAEIWLSRSSDPKRKLNLTLELVRADGALVGVHTGRANAIAAEAILAGQIPELAGYPSLRREIPYGERSRVDLLLEGGGRPICFVEVKSVTLARSRDGRLHAEFPDSVTARGAKHLRELAKAVAGGARAATLFLAQRADCAAFAPAADIDPAFATALDEARRAGVETLCYACQVEPGGIELHRPLPMTLIGRQPGTADSSGRGAKRT